MTHYQVSAEAQDDLFEIWRRIARDSVELANRIESEFYVLFESLSSMPRQGPSRKDLTKCPVLFFPLDSFLVVYQPETNPDSHHGGLAGQTRSQTYFERATVTQRFEDPKKRDRSSKSVPFVPAQSGCFARLQA
jgi:plasmid stabilization system protein ParE